jgi:hypothetical protein
MELGLDVAPNVQIVQLADDRRAFEKYDAPDQFLGVPHLGYRPLLHYLVELPISPVSAQFRMHHILVDGGQLVGKKKVELGNDFIVPFHGSSQMDSGLRQVM